MRNLVHMSFCTCVSIFAIAYIPFCFTFINAQSTDTVHFPFFLESPDLIQGTHMAQTSL